MTDLSKEFNPYEKKYSQPKAKKPMKKVSDKNKDPKTGFKKPTGELQMFKEVFKERGGKCQVTGRVIEFHPMSFLHILSKGAYPAFRLKKENIYMVIPDIHDLYDNASKLHLLSKYPKAEIIYHKKDELKIEYYNQPTI